MTDYILEPEDDPADVPASTKVALDLHPAAFKMIEGHSSDGIVGELKAVAVEAYISVGEFLDRLDAANRDPMNTPLRAQVLVADHVEKVSDAINRRFDAKREIAQRQIDALVRKMSAPIQAAPDPARLHIASDIRNHVKGLKKAERLGFLTKALESGDMETATAVLTGPAYLSGLTETEFAHVSRQYRAAKFPEEMARHDRLTKAVARLEKMQAVYASEVYRVIDWRQVQQARQTKAA